MTPSGTSSSGGQALHSGQSLLFAGRQLPTPWRLAAYSPAFGQRKPVSPQLHLFSKDSTRSLSTSPQAAAQVALEREENADKGPKQFLDLDGETDEELDDGSLEEEFEEEKGRRSLASIFGSDEDDYVEVDASLQDESLLVENCGLSATVVKALHERKVKSLFPIQKHVFDPAMAGRDLIGRAKTGSGKTLAFSLPVIEFLLKEHKDAGGRPMRGRPPRCIVLAPTRELAKQVEREFASSAPGLNVGCFYGGVSIDNQMRELRMGMDVVVGTPGRVIDLMERGKLDLSQIKFFILDEADMMLSQGFDEEVERILQGVPTERQTMLFSATMPSWVKRLTRQHLTQPVMVDLVGDTTSGRLNEDITALAVQVEPSMRRSVLVDVLTVHGAVGKSIIFTMTKREADEVAASVGQVLPCEALHGDMSQRDRERKLENFRRGKFTVLVATDVASRGLDIPNVDLVLHYELPRDIESFLHRSGRTARAGRTGTTIALFDRKETGLLRRIVKQVGVKNLGIMGPPGPKQVMEASAKQVLRRLDNIDDEVKAFFHPAAKLVMAQSDPEDALCRALAALSGLIEVPKPRSLLTQQDGYVTLRVTSRPGRIRTTGHVMTIVRNVLGTEACNEVGRIRMLPAGAEEDKEGAAFDLPEELVQKMLANEAELSSREFMLDLPKSLPLEEEHMQGRDSRGHRGGSRGGSYGGRRDGGYGGRDQRDGNRWSGRGRVGGGGGGGGGGGYSRGNYGGRNSYGDRGSRGGGSNRQPRSNSSRDSW